MKFTTLAIVLMISLGVGFWVVDRYIYSPFETGMYVRDVTSVDRFALCRAGVAAPGLLVVEEGHIAKAAQRCEIVFRRDEEIPMAGDGPYAFTRIGYRCAQGAPGPEETDGEVVLASGRAQMTSFIGSSGSTEDYVEAYSNYLSCLEVLNHASE